MNRLTTLSASQSSELLDMEVDNLHVAQDSQLVEGDRATSCSRDHLVLSDRYTFSSFFHSRTPHGRTGCPCDIAGEASGSLGRAVDMDRLRFLAELSQPPGKLISVPSLEYPSPRP